jgi:hypothetical protein
MSGRIVRESERNIRANDFLQEHKNDYTGNAFVTAKIAELKTEVTNAGNFYEEQISSHGDARRHYEIAADANDKLWQAMRDIADYAETMEDEVDGIEEMFRLTRSGGKRGRIARARAFAADAARYKEIFIGRGLEEDFIEDLNAKADALEQALSSAVSGTAGRVSATESKIQSFKKANKIIMALDPIIRRIYRNDPAKLAGWDFASHVQRDTERAKPQPTV